jgi:hypothetical protein
MKPQGVMACISVSAGMTPNEFVSRVTAAARWSSWAVRAWFVLASRRPPGWAVSVCGGAGQ